MNKEETIAAAELMVYGTAVFIEDADELVDGQLCLNEAKNETEITRPHNSIIDRQFIPNRWNQLLRN